MSAAKVQEFRKWGLVNCKLAEVYSALSSAIPGGRLRNYSSASFSMSGILLPPSGKHFLGLAAAVLPQSPLLFAWNPLNLFAQAGPGGTLPSRDRLCCWPGPGSFHIQAEFCSRPAAITSAWTRLFLVRAIVAPLTL